MYNTAPNNCLHSTIFCVPSHRIACSYIQSFGWCIGAFGFFFLYITAFLYVSHPFWHGCAVWMASINGGGAVVLRGVLTTNNYHYKAFESQKLLLNWKCLLITDRFHSIFSFNNLDLSTMLLIDLSCFKIQNEGEILRILIFIWNQI